LQIGCQSSRKETRRKREENKNVFERLQTAPKHVFEDSTAYTSQLQDNMDSIDDALQNGYYTSFLTSYCKLIKMYKNTAQQPII
jgi:hypothetical protein